MANSLPPAVVDQAGAELGTERSEDFVLPVTVPKVQAELQEQRSRQGGAAAPQVLELVTHADFPHLSATVALTARVASDAGWPSCRGAKRGESEVLVDYGDPRRRRHPREGR